MGRVPKDQHGAKDIPYGNAVRDPRLASQLKVWRLPKATKLMMPAAILFAGAGFLFTYKWNDDRAKNGPCVDCKRQQEMMEEVYFAKPSVKTGYRM